jgi:hypothetical protein
MRYLTDIFCGVLVFLVVWALLAFGFAASAREATTEYERAVLREFSEEMQEHGESEADQLRFYRHLQIAMKTAREMK